MFHITFAEDMTEQCLMCGASDKSFIHSDYVDWVSLNKCFCKLSFVDSPHRLTVIHVVRGCTLSVLVSQVMSLMESHLSV